LFLLVVNAALLAITAGISDRLQVDGFLTALLGGLILAVVGWGADLVLDR
jgi:putative membrane protein